MVSSEFFADIFGQEAQDEEAVLVKQLILSPVSAVCHRIREMLRAIEFHRDARVLPYRSTSSLAKPRTQSAGRR
jgi:hypothetical protein